MGSLPWILIAIGILLILLIIIALMITRKKKTKVNYYSFFISGLIWAAFGIPLKNYVLSAMGIIFIIIGLINKKTWKENRTRIKNLNKKQKIARIIIIGALTLLLIIAFILLMIKN